MNNSKKGLSDVVTTVLIILLVLAAIVIIWSFIRPTLVTTGTSIDAQSKCVSVEVEPVKCTLVTVDGDTTANEVAKNVGGDATKMRLILTHTDGTTATPVDVTAPARGATASNPFAIVSGKTAKEITVAGIVPTTDNKDYICPESPKVVPCSA